MATPIWSYNHAVKLVSLLSPPQPIHQLTNTFLHPLSWRCILPRTITSVCGLQALAVPVILITASGASSACSAASVAATTTLTPLRDSAATVAAASVTTTVITTAVVAACQPSQHTIQASLEQD